MVDALILRDAFMGVRRFEQFQTRLAIARNVLAARLESLVEHGIGRGSSCSATGTPAMSRAGQQ